MTNVEGCYRQSFPMSSHQRDQELWTAKTSRLYPTFGATSASTRLNGFILKMLIIIIQPDASCHLCASNNLTSVYVMLCGADLCIQSLFSAGIIINIIGRLRTPVRCAFSYGIRHVFIVIQWAVTHSSVNHNGNVPYPVWKCMQYGSLQPL